MHRRAAAGEAPADGEVLHEALDLEHRRSARCCSRGHLARRDGHRPRGARDARRAAAGRARRPRPRAGSGPRTRTGPAAPRATARARGSPGACSGRTSAGRGIAPSRPIVYGCCGCANSSSTGASSALRPAYITTTRSAMSAMTPRLCVIRTIAVPSRSRTSRIRSRMPGLDRDVERRRRLVGDQDLRVAGERHRDHHPLPHPARELVRILVHPPLRRGDPDELQELDRPRARRAPREPEVAVQDLADLAPDGEDRVERRHRLLEHVRDLAPAHLAQPPRREPEQVDAAELDAAARRSPSRGAGRAATCR